MATNIRTFGLALSEAPKIASYSIQDENHPQIELAPACHRINIINFFDIEPGSRVLEIGCGQGNCTTVLAAAVGKGGHIDAVDPASLDYGRPFTLNLVLRRTNFLANTSRCAAWTSIKRLYCRICSESNESVRSATCPYSGDPRIYGDFPRE